MRAELEKLIELQKTDTKVRSLRKTIQTAETRRAEIEQEFEQHAFSIREVQNRQSSLSADRASVEKEIAENRTYVERAERNLKFAQNQKEYEAALRETDVLQKQIKELETKLTEIAGSIEEVDGEIAGRSEEIEGFEAKREQALADFEAELVSCDKELQQENVKREAVLASVPKPLATAYDRLALRSRDGIAVAEVVNGSCSACFMSLRPQRLLEVKRMNEVIMCESCSRILYVASSNDEAASA